MRERESEKEKEKERMRERDRGGEKERNLFNIENKIYNIKGCIFRENIKLIN